MSSAEMARLSLTGRERGNKCETTGNKTIERNIAKVASEILPQTTVYGSQHVTEFEPGFIFKEDKDGKPVIDTIIYGSCKDGDTMTIPVDPTVYRGGKETTGHERR